MYRSSPVATTRRTCSTAKSLRRTPFSDVSGIPSRREPLGTKEMQVLNATPINQFFCRTLFQRPLRQPNQICHPDVLPPFWGGIATSHILLPLLGLLPLPGSFEDAGPNQSIVVTSASGSRVKIGSSCRISRSRSQPESTPNCDQNLPTDHYSNRLFRHILLLPRLLRKMG